MTCAQREPIKIEIVDTPAGQAGARFSGSTGFELVPDKKRGNQWLRRVKSRGSRFYVIRHMAAECVSAR